MSFEARRLLREKLETGFTVALIFYIFTLVLNVMVYIADLFAVSGLQELLAVSPKTPWGIVTSFFVHVDEAHLLNNMISLFLFLMLLVASNAFLSEKEVKKRIIITLLIIFLIPTFLNLFILFVYPDLQIIGSSGIVYTLEGMSLGFSLLNALELRKIRKSIQNDRQFPFIFSLSNLVIFVGFLIILLFYPLDFFGGRFGAILQLHSLAFSCGFISAISYQIWHPKFSA